MTKPADRQRKLSPAAAHRERVHAEQNSKNATSNTEAASAYELKLMELAQDNRDLKNIKGVAFKIEKKIELLPKYIPWVQGVIESEAGTQDDVLVTMLVWSIDAGNTELTLQIAEYAIKHKLAMLDTYQRDIPNVLAEEIADAQIKLRTSETGMQPDVIKKVIELTEKTDLFDPVRAKLHKALGYALHDTDKPAALLELQKALAIHDKSGVKKDIEHLEREIKNSGNQS